MRQHNTAIIQGEHGWRHLCDPPDPCTLTCLHGKRVGNLYVYLLLTAGLSDRTDDVWVRNFHPYRVDDPTPEALPSKYWTH